MKKDSNIEFRSEKVRKLLGDMPRELEIGGLIIMAIILLALILVACLAPYPYSDGESILRHLLGYVLAAS